MTLNATRTISTRMMPTTENKIVSKDFFFIARCRLTSAALAQNHACCEQRKNNQRQEEYNVARIEHAFLETVEVRDDADAADSVHKPRLCPAHEEVRDRRKS